MVDAFMGSLKTMETGAVTDTPVAPDAGDDDKTVGGITSLTVNADEKAADIALPATSLTPFNTTETVTPLGYWPTGRNSAVCDDCAYVIPPGTITPPLAVTPKLDALSDD